MRSTHTFVELEVSAEAYDEIRAKLDAAGYDHALVPFEEGVTLDMHGIGLTRKRPPDLSQSFGIEPRSSRLARELRVPRGFVTSDSALIEADRAEIMDKMRDGLIGPASGVVILESGASCVFEAAKDAGLDLVEVFPC